MYRINTIITILFMLLLVGGCATPTVAPDEFSGYLGDYSKLKQTKDEQGREILHWESSKLKKSEYIKIILDKVVFYPAPEPTTQISNKVLEEVRAYTNEALRREVSKVISVTGQPGENVLRLRVALTGVSTDPEALHGYEYIPIAAIAAGVTSATGARDRVPHIVIEAELLDSRTGERLALTVRRDAAEKLLENDKEQLTLDDMRESIDEAALGANRFLIRTVK